MAIIEINETHRVWNEDESYWDTESSETFIIDTDKVDEHMADDPHAFHYTKFIIAAAREGNTEHEASRKYSFTDTEDEYALCRADEGAKVDHVMNVELNY